MYVSLILTPKLLTATYDRMQADRRLLSRNTEFGGTLTSAMVPWSDNGIFMSGILGVATLSYLPYLWLSWSCIILALGVSTWRTMQGKTTTFSGSPEAHNIEDNALLQPNTDKQG